MGEEKRLVKNTMIIAIGNLSTKVVSFLLLPLYTAVLTTSEYGTVDYISSICIFCVPFVNLLMNETMFRFLIDCKSQKDYSRVISISLIITLVGTILFLLISLPILCFIKYEYSFYLIMYTIATAISNMISALLRGKGRTDLYSIFNFAASVLNIILNIFFIVNLNLGVRGMLLAYIISQFLMSFIFCIKVKLWQYIKLSLFDFGFSKTMIQYSVPLIPNSLSWSIINLLDRLIIMNVLGSSSSGLYAIAYKFPNVVDMVYGFFYQSWKESSARALNHENIDKFYNSVYKILKSVMFSIIICMVAFMPIIFKIMIDPSYNGAIVYVPILLFAIYFSNISGFYGGIFTAFKNTKIMGTTTIVAAIINTIVNISLIWRFGLYAAAISTLVSNYIIYLYRKYKLKDYILLYENKFKSVLAIIVSLIILFLFYSMNNYFQVLGCIIALGYSLYINRITLKYCYKFIKRKLVK